MKYEKEINQMLKDLFYEEWMSEEDFAEFKQEFLKQSGITMKKLDHEVQVGVDNGISVEDQMEISKRAFNTLH